MILQERHNYRDILKSVVARRLGGRTEQVKRKKYFRAVKLICDGGYRTLCVCKNP